MKEKRLDYEVLRLIAIVGVVFNHTSGRGFDLYMAEGCSGINYVGSLLLGILCKIAVPLFFLVSGGLLLAKEERISTVLVKRVLRILLALVIFSGVLYLFWIRWDYVTKAGVQDFLSRLWSTGVSIPYWYLYAYLGILLMLPLLRAMVKAMSDMAFVYLAFVHILLYGVLGTAAFCLKLGPLHSDFLIPLAEPCLFYFIMGYYLSHRFSWELMRKKDLGFLWGIALLSLAIMFALADADVGRNGTVTINYLESLMVFPVFAVYATVHQLFTWHRPPQWVAKTITALGGCVFGTYLLEGILRYELGFIYQFLEPRIHVLPACMVWVAVVVVCGLSITWVLKKIPGLKKIL